MAPTVTGPTRKPIPTTATALLTHSSLFFTHLLANDSPGKTDDLRRTVYAAPGARSTAALLATTITKRELLGWGC